MEKHSHDTDYEYMRISSFSLRMHLFMSMKADQELWTTLYYSYSKEGGG
jgi:hypothetical protein